MSNDIKILLKKIDILNKNYYKYKEQNHIDETEFNECLCDVLSWMEICIKKIQILNVIEGEKISAIKYANNMKKHSVSIYKYNLNSYALFPSDNLYPSNYLYPIDFNIYWNSLPLDNDKFKNQYNNYNKHLKLKEVHQTINDVCKIIIDNYQ